MDIPDTGDAPGWEVPHSGPPAGARGSTTKETELVSIKNHLVRTAAIGALGLATTIGFVAPASASQTASAHLAGIAAAAKPNTNIQGSPAKWNPTKLTAAPIKGTCSAKNFSFSITNKTSKTQTIQFKSGTGGKKTLGSLKKGQKGAVCATGSKGAKATFFIKGAKSTLTVTLS